MPPQDFSRLRTATAPREAFESPQQGRNSSYRVSRLLLHEIPSRVVSNNIKCIIHHYGKSADCKHTRRAAQQAQIWRQAFQTKQILPLATDWGWTQENGKWVPVWRTIPVAAESCNAFVRCKCKLACSGNCSCRKKGIKCRELCSYYCASLRLIMCRYFYTVSQTNGSSSPHALYSVAWFTRSENFCQR
ncbi:Threonine--tRNA ligase [Frankliniella fusca]|uniref:Threonine--tRNA ligase n=1 Tax=Frankliniella fusca TaxID=407009 RepID=A0AAE1LDL0_9NEOP|nr:Threonine--tRNA ligase [Frankliniella fusca]